MVGGAEPRAGAGAAPHSEPWDQGAPVSSKPPRWSLLCPRLRNSGLEAQRWVGLGVKKAEVVRAEGPGRKRQRPSPEPGRSGAGPPGTRPSGAAGPLQNQDAARPRAPGLRLRRAACHPPGGFVTKAGSEFEQVPGMRGEQAAWGDSSEGGPETCSPPSSVRTCPAPWRSPGPPPEEGGSCLLPR